MFDCIRPPSEPVLGVGPNSDQPEDSNPRFLGRLGKSRCHKMYGAAVGASGRIYFGGRWMRTGNGGGLGWWEPSSGEEDGIWEPFSAQMIAHLCPANGGRHIAISTRKVQDLTLKKPTPNEGKLFVFEDAGKKLVREITVVEGVAGPGPIAWAGGGRVIGWTDDPGDDKASILWGADVEKGEVVWRLPLPYALPVEIGSNQEEAWDFRLAPDGKIWTFMGAAGKTLVKIDPRTVEIEAVAEVDKGGRLAFSGEDVYLAGGKALRRIEGIGVGP